MYVHTREEDPSSRRKSHREIIMQKMHREDYDLICRARKQFVSLKEESLVNLQNYRLPRGCVCAQCFIIWGKSEATRGKEDVYVCVCVFVSVASRRIRERYGLFRVYSVRSRFPDRKFARVRSESQSQVRDYFVRVNFSKLVAASSVSIRITREFPRGSRHL